MMDGSEHTAPGRITGCCDFWNEKCWKCGGYVHVQPVYAGLGRLCENCDDF